MKKPEWILGIAIVLCLVMPSVLTKFSSCIYFNKDTGEIGDTIGGLTAPIIGLLNAILVYLALKSQIEANDKIQKRQDEQEAKQKEDNKKIEEKFEEKEREETRIKKVTEIVEKISFIKTTLDNFEFTIMKIDELLETDESTIMANGNIALRNLIYGLKNDESSENPQRFVKYPSVYYFTKIMTTI